MRRAGSVKKRLALWLTVLMAVLSVLLLVFLLIVSESVADRTAREELTQTARYNAALVSLVDGRLSVAEGFRYSQGGITTLVYSEGETLLAGQVPVSFAAAGGFESGVIRTVESESGETAWLVLDVWVPSGWDAGVWLRLVTEAPDIRGLARNMTLISMVILPVFVLLAAGGSYLITRRAFRPLDRINATAEAINEARDLSGRIGLPAGRDEFSRLAANFDEMFERLERSFEAEKRFTADASHELRTPVSVIKGACEYAEKYGEQDSPEERRENIEMIHRQADRMAGLITQLLQMTRMEQGTEGRTMQRLDLGAEVAALCAEQFPDEPRLTVEAGEGIFVVADRALLGRLLRNLVENAFKYAREGESPRVHVTAAIADGEATLTVADNGIGIPAEEREKIWTRFYRVDPSRTDTEGTGLGLSIVESIARLLGGYMTLESEVGVGSRFVLHLKQNAPSKDGHPERTK